MKKILIIRFSSIGDIVLTTPVIRLLREQVHNVEIHFITKKQYEDVLKSNKYIDKLHLFSGSYKKCISKLKKENFDYIIDLHRSIRSSRIKLSLRVKSSSFRKLNFKKWLFVNFKINKMPNVHIVDRYVETIKSFNVVNDNKGLDFFVSDDREVVSEELPEQFQNGFAVFAIGANHYTKRLPIEKIIEICKGITYPIIIAGGKSDEDIGEIVKQKIGERIYNVCGKFTIEQSASIVKQSVLLLSHDTGLMHIGAAFHKNIISIWGNTVPDFGMYPYLPGNLSKIFEVNNLKCRPCSKIGYKKCPKEHFNCMNRINTNEIIEYANGIIKLQQK